MPPRLFTNSTLDGEPTSFDGISDEMSGFYERSVFNQALLLEVLIL
jgi:hypothetical protein